MKLTVARALSDLRPVLMDSTASGSDVVYWVFAEISQEKFADLTVIAAGKIGREFPKTFGHYHQVDVLETYKLISGNGILVLQKKTSNPKTVSEVLLVRASQGDEIVIPPEYGHSWSNVGVEPLLLADDWRSGHTPADYQVMAELHGLAYYLTGTSQNILPVANQNYLDLPPFKWITTADLAKI